jgi:hypothetical protein
MDEFVARTFAARAATPADATETRQATDASLTSKAACTEHQPPANKVATVPIASSKTSVVEVLPIPPRVTIEESPVFPAASRIEETPDYASRRWRAEAWERERALHAVDRRNETTVRHR